MAHFGVDAVGEVHRGTPLRERDDIALGSEDEDLGGGQVVAQCIEELVGVLGLTLPLQELPQPSEVIGALLASHIALLVPPVRRDAELRRTMHVPGADLQLHGLAVGSDDRGVQRLVHVELRHRDEVLEASRHRTPARVDDPEHRVAVADGLDEDANADEVVDIGELAAPHDHLLVDRIQMLGAPGDRCLDPGPPDVRLQLVDHAREVLIPRGSTLGDQALDLVVDLGVQGREGQVLQLPLHGVHAESVRQGRVDLQGLSRLLLLLLRRHEAQGAHVVKSIG